MSKRTKIIIIIVAVVLIITVAYLLFRKKPVTQQATQLPADAFAGANGFTTPPATDAFPLERGDKGQNVRRLQVALNRIKPENKIAEDGIYGNSTYVKLVQSIATSLYGPEGSVSENQLNYLIMLGNKS